MKKFICIFIIPLFLLPVVGFRAFENPSPPPTSFLGFNLMSGPNSGLITYAIVTVLQNGQKDVHFITRNEFISIASGVMACDANPRKENFFVKYEVEECGVIRDSIFKKTHFSCLSVDHLWKLRYSIGPYLNGPDSMGWTKSTVPSVGQMSILKNYGVNSLDDFIYGEKAFQLLHDMQSFAWVSRYAGS